MDVTFREDTNYFQPSQSPLQGENLSNGEQEEVLVQWTNTNAMDQIAIIGGNAVNQGEEKDKNELDLGEAGEETVDFDNSVDVDNSRKQEELGNIGLNRLDKGEILTYSRRKQANQ